MTNGDSKWIYRFFFFNMTHQGAAGCQTPVGQSNSAPFLKERVVFQGRQRFALHYNHLKSFAPEALLLLVVFLAIF